MHDHLSPQIIEHKNTTTYDLMEVWNTGPDLGEAQNGSPTIQDSVHFQLFTFNMFFML